MLSFVSIIVHHPQGHGMVESHVPVSDELYEDLEKSEDPTLFVREKIDSKVVKYSCAYQIIE